MKTQLAPATWTADGGGRTRFGIAEKFHPDLPEEFFTGPAEDALAEAEKIEEREYWNSMRLAEVENQNAANKIFDMGVNMGVRQAGVYAQRAVNSQFQQFQAGSSQKTATSGRRPWRPSTPWIRKSSTGCFANSARGITATSPPTIPAQAATGSRSTASV